MSDSTQPCEPEPAKPMLLENRIDSLEVRVSVLEAQQNWLHLEQLRAEVAGLRQTVDYLIEYIAERDSCAVNKAKGD